MKLWILSDLLLLLEDTDLSARLPIPDADVCVVGRDLCRAWQMAFTG